MYICCNVVACLHSHCNHGNNNAFFFVLLLHVIVNNIQLLKVLPWKYNSVLLLYCGTIYVYVNNKEYCVAMEIHCIVKLHVAVNNVKLLSVAVDLQQWVTCALL